MLDTEAVARRMYVGFLWFSRQVIECMCRSVLFALTHRQ